MSRRKRVVFLINSLTGGGAERVMCTLLRHSLAECEEFEVTLALLDDEPAAYAPPEWVSVRQLDCRHSLAGSVFAVRALYAQIKPDVSLSFLTRANVANVLNARMPCVISERANTSAHFDNSLRGTASRALVRALYPRATRVIAVSEGVAEDLRENFGVRAERVAAIANPVDVEAIRAKALQRPAVEIEGAYIMAAGRLVKSKNFDMLIRAFAASNSSSKLLIVGEGGEREALLQTAQACGVADRVLMPGFVENPYPLMAGAELFALSSNAEGFPNALVEAMAVGAPVVAANCASGPSEILAEAARDTIKQLTFAAHGVLVPPDAPGHMAEALRAMEDGQRRRDYAARAAARARAFSPQAAKDRYWDVLRSALGAAVAR
jgi:N-acetylgalactosamine-N,N'-diacetylbacillosaminyl-diphospho-undecaprenol 4-alpha-N-acetylgalactosaminyltransferase